MKQWKILLLAEQRNDYVCTQMNALQRGFIHSGADCKTYFHAHPEDANRHIQTLQPDAIMEINTSRKQSPCAIPSEVRHISWIQDVRTPDGRIHYVDPDFGGSDLYYTLLDADYFCLQPVQHPNASWSILHTGVEASTYHPSHDTPYQPGTASLCGYLPLPLQRDASFMQKAVIEHNKRKLTQGHLIERLYVKEQISVNRHGYGAIHEMIRDEFCQIVGISPSIRQLLEIMGNTPFFIFIDTEIPRMTSRARLIESARSSGLAISVYGPDSWRYWPEFSKDYKGMLNWPSDLACVYRQTQFNLHNGAFGMHSRVLECMGSGGIILVNHNKTEHGNHRICDHFEEGVHYLAYDEENAQDVMRQWQNKDKELHAMRNAAAETVLKHHQWHHRAAQILEDLNLQAGLSH